MLIDSALSRTIISTYGPQGEHWLLRLPSLIARYEHRWGLTELKPLAGLTHNVVLAGYKDAQPIVLKLSLCPWELAREAQALQAMGPYGAVTLIDKDESALLLERIVGTTMLASYAFARDDEATAIFCQVLDRLADAPLADKGFIHIKDCLAELDNDWPLPTDILACAQELSRRLASSLGPLCLLHGDLHHGNIIKGAGQWHIIDPKGFIGERLFEAGAYIRNPIDKLAIHPQAARIITARIEKIAHFFSADPMRLWQWAVVQAVLAWIWAQQDKLALEPYQKIAEIITHSYSKYQVSSTKII